MDGSAAGNGEQGTGESIQPGGTDVEGSEPTGESGDGESQNDVAQISADVLPEGLQGKSEAEVRFALHRMLDGATDHAKEIAELRGRLEAMGTNRLPEPEVPDPHADKDINELILEDAEAAILRVLKKSGLTDRISSTETRIGQTELESVSQQFPDFSEHESNVKQLLVDQNLTPTREHIEAAYYISLGHATSQQRLAAARAASNPSAADPSSPAEEVTKETVLNSLEAEFADKMNMTPEDFRKYGKDGDVEITVPLTGGRRG